MRCRYFISFFVVCRPTTPGEGLPRITVYIKKYTIKLHNNMHCRFLRYSFFVYSDFPPFPPERRGGPNFGFFRMYMILQVNPLFSDPTGIVGTRRFCRVFVTIVIK